jgi:hypothetical protein
MLAVYGALLIIIAAATAAVAIPWLSSPSQDKIAVIGNFLALGTLLLALVAGIVALAAYSAATGLPNLRLNISLPLAGPYANFVVLLAEDSLIMKPSGTNDKEMVQTPTKITTTSGVNTATIVVENTTRYAARTPAVIIQFHRCRLVLDQAVEEVAAASAGWTPTQYYSRPGRGVIAVQWDGGPNYAIHGNSARHLPDLNLQLLQLVEPPAAGELIVRLLADGYDRSTIRLPITLIEDPYFRAIPPTATKEWM